MVHAAFGCTRGSAWPPAPCQHRSALDEDCEVGGRHALDPFAQRLHHLARSDQRTEIGALCRSAIHEGTDPLGRQDNGRKGGGALEQLTRPLVGLGLRTEGRLQHRSAVAVTPWRGKRCIVVGQHRLADPDSCLLGDLDVPRPGECRNPRAQFLERVGRIATFEGSARDAADEGVEATATIRAAAATNAGHQG